MRQIARGFALVPDLDGMIEVRGRLNPEQGALRMRAIEAASDMLFRDAGGNPVLEVLQWAGSAREKERIAARRRLTCDARVVEVSRRPSGELLDFGRRTRSSGIRSGWKQPTTGELRSHPCCGGERPDGGEWTATGMRNPAAVARARMNRSATPDSAGSVRGSETPKFDADGAHLRCAPHPCRETHQI